MSAQAEMGETTRRPSEVPADAPRPLVLHVVEALAAGTLRHVIDLVRCVSEADHVIAGPAHHHGQSTAGALAAARAAGAEVEIVEMGRFLAPHRHLSALRALRRTIARRRPDVVHGHSAIGGTMARLAGIGTGIPVVYTPHGVRRSRWVLLAERALRDRADRVIAVSGSERKFLLAHRVARPQQTLVIVNGVDPVPPPATGESLRGALGIPKDVPLIGCVGRLTRQKAPEVFVAACGLLSQIRPEAQFVLIGAGALHGVVASAVREAGIEDRFHLVPSHPDAAAVLSELDVFALPSRFEGAAYTPLEAMRAGTPVVVTDVVGNRDLVRHGENGLMVRPEDPEGLAASMLRLLDDGPLRRRLISNAQDTVACCDIRSMAYVTAALYRQLSAIETVSRRPPPRTAAHARPRSSAKKTL